MPMTHKEKRLRRRHIAMACKSRHVDAVALSFGVCYNTVTKACREYDVKYRRRPFTKDLGSHLRAFKIVRLLGEGRSVRSIADMVGLTSARVRQIKVMAIEAGLLKP